MVRVTPLPRSQVPLQQVFTFGQLPELALASSVSGRLRPTYAAVGDTWGDPPKRGALRNGNDQNVLN